MGLSLGMNIEERIHKKKKQTAGAVQEPAAASANASAESESAESAS
jgi:hypothetical protein